MQIVGGKHTPFGEVVRFAGTPASPSLAGDYGQAGLAHKKRARPSRPSPSFGRKDCGYAILARRSLIPSTLSATFAGDTADALRSAFDW